MRIIFKDEWLPGGAGGAAGPDLGRGAEPALSLGAAPGQDPPRDLDPLDIPFERSGSGTAFHYQEPPSPPAPDDDPLGPGWGWEAWLGEDEAREAGQTQEAARAEPGGMAAPQEAARIPPAAEAVSIAAQASPPPASMEELAALSKSLGVPAEVLARQPERLRKMWLAKSLMDNPALLAFAKKSPLHADVASANAEPAKKAAGAFRDLGRAAKYRTGEKGLSDYLLDPAKNYLNGWLDLARGVIASGMSVSDLAAGQDSAVSQWFAGALKSLRGLELETHEPANLADRLANDVTRNVPQLLAQFGAASLGGLPAAGAFMFSHIYGLDYERHAAAGISPENAAFAAAMDAALQASLETLGLKMVMKIPGVHTLAQSAGRFGWREFLKSGARGAGAEAVTEALQHAPEYVTDYWAKSSLQFESLSDRAAWTWRQAADWENFMQGTKEAVYEGLVGGILGGGASSINTAVNRYRLDPEVRGFLENERELAEGVTRRLGLDAAMTRARAALAGIKDPAQARMIADAVIPREARSAVITYEDLTALIEKGAASPSDIAAIIGESGEEALEAALAQKTDLDLDAAALAASNSPAALILSESLRLNPEGPALAAAKAWSPDKALSEAAAILFQEDDLDGIDGAPREDLRKEEAARLISVNGNINRAMTRLTRELKQAGMTDLEAESNAALLRAHALAWWKRYGVDGSLILDRLSIRREESGPAESGEDPQGGRPAWMGGKKEPKGSIALSKASAIIRLFSRRDASTFSHEAGHLFLQDLMEINNIDPDSIRDGVLDDLEGSLAGDLDFLQELDEEWRDLTEAGAPGPESLRGFARALLEKKSAQDKIAESLFQNFAENDPNAAQSPEYWRARGRAGAAARAAKKAREAARHLEGMIQAREDLAAIAAHAGLNKAELDLALARAASLDPAAPPAQKAAYTKIQEAAQEAFMRYLMSGRAPSARLEKAMARLAGWLRNLWRRYQAASPAPPRPELVRAFNRLLAADADERAQLEADALAGRESAFIAGSGLAPKTAEKLRDLLNRAQARSLGRMERSLARAEEKFRKRRVRELMKAHAEEPLWVIAENACFDLDEVKKIMGAGPASELARAAPNLFHDPKGSIGEAWKAGGFKSAEDMLSQMHGTAVKNARPDALAGASARFDLNEAKKLIGDERARELAGALPKLFRRQRKKTDLEDAWRRGGWESAEDMLTALHETLAAKGRTRKSISEDQAEEEIARRRREIWDKASFLNPALGSYLNEADRAVAAMAARRHFQNELEAERWAQASHVPQTVIDAWAARRMEDTPVNKLSPQSLNRSLAACLARRDKLLAQGAPQAMMGALNEAAEARVIYKIMENAHLARRRLAELKSYAKKAAAAPAGTYPAMHAEALRLTLEAYGLGVLRQPVDPAQSRALADLIADIGAENDIAPSMAVFPDWLVSRVRPGAGGRYQGQIISPETLSPRQIEELHNLLKFLVENGRQNSQALANSRKRKAESAAASCAAAMEALPDLADAKSGFARAFSGLGRKAFAAVDTLLYLAQKADGLNNVFGKGERGPLESLVYDIFAAEERVKGWHDKIYRAMSPHLDQLRALQGRLDSLYGRNMELKGRDGQPVAAPAAYQKAYRKSRWTSEMLIAAALHMGTRSNAARLISGWKLTARDIEALFGSRMAQSLFPGESWLAQGPRAPGLLSASDWKAVQGVWDAIALLWPDIKAAHIKTHGFAPEQIPASPFTVDGGNGAPLPLKGGYFPVRYDPRASDKVAAWTERDILDAANEAQFQGLSVRDSATRARSRKAPGYPVRLDLSPIAEHVDQMAKFIEVADTARMINSIRMNPAFKECYVRKYGLDSYQQFKPALQGLLTNERPSDVITWLERKIRAFVIPWCLSLNVNVALVQGTAVFPGMGDAGARPVLKAMARLAAHPTLCREIWKASPYLKSRMRGLDQDLSRKLVNFTLRRPKTLRIGSREWSWQDLVDLGMMGITCVDQAATCAVWLGAYEAKLKELRQSRPAQGPAPIPDAPPAPGPDPAPAPDPLDAAPPPGPAPLSEAEIRPAAPRGPAAAPALDSGARRKALLALEMFIGQNPERSLAPAEKAEAFALFDEFMRGKDPDDFYDNETALLRAFIAEELAGSSGLFPAPRLTFTERGLAHKLARKIKKGLDPASLNKEERSVWEKYRLEEADRDAAGIKSPLSPARRERAQRLRAELAAGHNLVEYSLADQALIAALANEPHGPVLNNPRGPREDGTSPAAGLVLNARPGSAPNIQDAPGSNPDLIQEAAGPRPDLPPDGSAPGGGAPDFILDEAGSSPDAAGSSWLSRLHPRLGGLNVIQWDDACHEAASRHADAVVKQSNPDFDPSSRSAFLRSKGVMRIFNQFSSALSLFAARQNLAAAALAKGKITKAAYARHGLYEYLLPAVSLALLYGALRDWWDKKYEPGSSMAKYLADQLAMGYFPIAGSFAGDIASLALNYGSGNPRAGEGLQTSFQSFFTIIKNDAKAIGNLLSSGRMSREQKKAAIYALADTASFIAKVPVSKAARKAERGWDQRARGEGAWFSILSPKPGK